MGIILFIVSVFLLWLLSPLMIIYAIFRAKNKSKYFGLIAFAIDQMGNVLGADIMNDILLEKSATKLYGNPDETISHVTGVNYLNNDLTCFGILLAKILNFIDKDHVQKAAKNEQ